MSDERCGECGHTGHSPELCGGMCRLESHNTWFPCCCTEDSKPDTSEAEALKKD
jgi:hypothetical protein